VRRPARPPIMLVTVSLAALLVGHVRLELEVAALSALGPFRLPFSAASSFPLLGADPAACACCTGPTVPLLARFPQIPKSIKFNDSSCPCRRNHTKLCAPHQRRRPHPP
jgi:hypothetical protein